MVNPSQVTASAPGKLILMGEHAAVYGRPALVAALGLRTRVRVTRRQDDRVRLVLSNVGVDVGLDWSAIVAYGDAARIAWEAYMADEGSDELRRMSAGDAGHVVKVALAETARTIETAVPSAGGPGIDVEVSSQLPVGGGFGSSASIAVATAGALSQLFSGAADPEAVGGIALETERRQHGRPSGVDHGAVLRGGVLWMEPSGEGRAQATALRLVPQALSGLTVFHTGTPVESTGEMVEAVRRRFDQRPAELEEILAGMEAKVYRLREVLTERSEPGASKSGASESGASESGVSESGVSEPGVYQSGVSGFGVPESGAMVEVLRGFEADLEALGVVPAAVCGVIREIEAAGGAAKVSGAGGLSAGRAGSLLVYHPDDSVAEMPVLGPYRRFDTELGVTGLEVESVP